MGEQIKITFQQILDESPCVDGWAKLLLAKDVIDQKTHNKWITTRRYSNVELPTEKFPLSDILETNDVQDTVWALRCINNKKMATKIAISLVHQVEHLMTDQRSKDALRVAWSYTNGKATRGELEKAADTAVRAYADAVYDVIYAADTAVRAYADAVYDAVYGVVYNTDAGDKEIKEKQKQLLREVLDSGECKCPWESENDN